jgi:hypothetical protein
MQLRLQLPANEKFRYHAGQYIEFILRDGARRAYSMANAPHTQETAPGIELHIRHMPGGKFTDHVFGAMKEKEILRVEGPFGSFFLREDSDKPIVLLASGTGFAPIKALIEHMQHRASPAPPRCTGAAAARRPVHGRLDARAPGRLPQLRYVPVVSDALPEDGWTAAPALCTRPCWTTLPTCPATRSMPAARPSWWIRRAPIPAARPAGRRVLRRRLHLRSRQARRLKSPNRAHRRLPAGSRYRFFHSRPSMNRRQLLLSAAAVAAASVTSLGQAQDGPSA